MRPALISLLQQVGLECICCGQIYHPDQAFEDGSEAQLFGADPYVICAVCEMNVPEGLRDESYKERWHRAMQLHLSQPELKLLVALSLLTSHTSAPVTDKLFQIVLQKLNNRYPDKTLTELKVAGDQLWDLLNNGLS